LQKFLSASSELEENQVIERYSVQLRSVTSNSSKPKADLLVHEGESSRTVCDSLKDVDFKNVERPCEAKPDSFMKLNPIVTTKEPVRLAQINLLSEASENVA